MERNQKFFIYIILQDMNYCNFVASTSRVCFDFFNRLLWTFLFLDRRSLLSNRVTHIISDKM